MNTKPTIKSFALVILPTVMVLFVIFVLVMPKVRENRTNRENIITPEKITKEVITGLISQRFNRPVDILTVEITTDTGKFAKGIYNEDEAGGGVWLAVKTVNGWELASAGNGIVSCGEISKYDFPEEIVSSCLDNGSVVDLSWLKIKNAIKNCEVESVFQNHSREVSVKLKNGNEISATEPEIDNVIDLATSAAYTCGDIIMATE